MMEEVSKANNMLGLEGARKFLREISWTSEIPQEKILMALRDALTEKFKETVEINLTAAIIGLFGSISEVLLIFLLHKHCIF